MICGAALFPALICGTAFLINFVAIYYHASRAIPILTMVTILATPPASNHSVFSTVGSGLSMSICCAATQPSGNSPGS